MQVGGAERHLLRIATALAQTGISVQVFAFQPDGPLRPLFEQQGIPVHGFIAPEWLQRTIKHPRSYAWIVLFIAAFRLWRAIWRLKPQVIHYFLPLAYIVGRLVSLFGPHAFHVMSRRSMNHYQAKHRLFARIERLLHPSLNRVTGNSQAVVAQLIDEGVPNDRLRLIYSGIEATQFYVPEMRTATRSSLGLEHDSLVFVMVANLIPYKGHADLIDAFSLIQEHLPKNWHVLIIGRDDGIQTGLQERCKNAGIADHFHFLGSRTDIAALLSSSDVGVLCSHQEGFSNSVLEGMAAGLPMVVTDVGGNAEAVIDGEHGYVVPAHCPSQLGEALLRVANDELRALMGNRARQHVRERFSMQACITAYQALYREIDAGK